MHKGVINWYIKRHVDLRNRLNKKNKEQRLFFWDMGKLVTPGLLLKKCTDKKLKVHANTVHASVKKIIP